VLSMLIELNFVILVLSPRA